MARKRKNEIRYILSTAIAILLFMLVGFGYDKIGITNVITNIDNNEIHKNDTTATIDINDIPKYNGQIYIEINNNIPVFSEEDFNITEDYYSELENKKARNGNDKD